MNIKYIENKNLNNLEILKDGHSFLNYKQEPYTGNFTELHPLITKMFEMMHTANGIGLAANQVGVYVNMFIMNVNKRKVCINPTIIDYSLDTIVLREGCLSYPNKQYDINRSFSIYVAYYTEYGILVDERLYGLEARCFLHEFDHINGITFNQRI